MKKKHQRLKKTCIDIYLYQTKEDHARLAVIFEFTYTEIEMLTKLSSPAAPDIIQMAALL